MAPSLRQAADDCVTLGVGGARTVDVHIRRLRAKLGEEHAGLIQTVRSVGYRFGQPRWAV